MMATDLEDRLRSAGDQIDRRIAMTAHRQRAVVAPRRSLWSLAVAASAGALLVVALVWVTGHGDGGVRPAGPVPASTAASPSSPASTEAAQVTAPSSSDVVAAATPTSVPAPPPPPVAIGESVMLGARAQLQAGGFAVVAEISHQADWIVDTVARLRAEGRIGTDVVVQVGTNGQTTPEQLDEIMSYLPADEVPTVVLLTVRAPGKGWIDGNNEHIWALQGRYPNVKVLDWKGLVDSGQIPGMAGDGAHLGTEAAKQTYANYIFSMIGRNDLVVPVSPP
jgi:hypothetical protein